MSSKSRETTKTAHVMHLLRKNSPGSPASEEAAPLSVPQTAEQPEAVQTHTPVKHPLIASLNEEAIVAQEIKGILEAELEKTERLEGKLLPEEPTAQVAGAVMHPEETAPDAQAAMESGPLTDELLEEPAESAAEPAPESVERVVEPAVEQVMEPVEPKKDVHSAEAEQIEPPAVEEPSVQEADRVAQVADQAAPDSVETGLDCYNVMQVMVEEGSERYMKMFGICQCPRCKADVKAIALNSLQPKYVVMQPGEYIPRLTVYERQFSSTVTAQILRACNIVAEHPRHDVR